MKSYEVQEILYCNSKTNSIDVKQSISSSKNSNHIKDMLNDTNIMNDEFYHIIEEENQGKDLVGGILQPISREVQGIHQPIILRNPSAHSVFMNNTLIQPNLIENLQKSFHEDCPTNEHDFKNEIKTFQMKKCLFHYKGITEKIERHLSDEKNLFSIFKTIFIRHFCQKHHYFDQYADLKIASKQIFKELRVFINFFQETLCSFYKLNDYKSVVNYFLFTKENIQNFVTSIIFGCNEIADLIFVINQTLHKEEEDQLKAQYENAKEFLPGDFDVSHKYCLNEKTIQYIFEKKNVLSCEKSNYTSTVLPERSFRTSNTLSENKKNGFGNLTKTYEFLEDETQKIKVKLKEKRPFEKAIKNLRRITQNPSPLHKLKTILQTSEYLFQEIRDFYCEFNMHLNEGLGGDELLGLFVYIVAQARVPDLLSHCATIKAFLTSNLTSSISGYYLVTIQVALDYILSMKIDKKSRTFSSMKEFHQFVKVVNEKTI